MGVQINGDTGNVSATKGTYSSNLTVGGVLTFEDVTNVDSIGIVTARTDINLGDSIIHIDDTNTKIRFPEADTITAETGGSERLRIASNGRVNIGDRTTTPDELVHIHTASGEANVHVEAATNANLNLRSHSGDSTIQFSDASASNVGNINYDHGTDSLSFRTNSDERLRIHSDGKMSLGTTSSTTAKFNISHGNEFGLYTSGGYNFQAKFESTDAEAAIVIEDSNSTNDGNRIGVITNDMTFITNDTEKVRITSAGAFGFNTSTVTIRENIHTHQTDSAQNYLRFTNTGTGSGASDGFNIGITAAEEAIVWNFENTDTLFATNNTERLRIQSTGRVLIGTTSPLQNTSSTSPALQIKGAGGGPYVVVLQNNDTSGGAAMIQFFDGSGDDCGDIFSSATNNTTSYNTSSDYRKKENTVNLSDGITRIKQLKPYRFNFISNPDKTKVDGFYAHEVSDVVPEAITGIKDEVDSEGNPKYQKIDHSKLVPLLTAALQEAIAKIETLETKVAALEG